MRRPERIGLVVAAVAVVALLVWGSSRPPEGPVEPVWDHTRCTRCGMLLSEPRFAAQVQLRDGTVLHYDDPGCLLLDDARASDLAQAHAVWFHHAEAPRWVPLDAVGFAPTDVTPMDFGLAAVERAGREDVLDVEAARVHAAARAAAAPSARRPAGEQAP